MSKILKYDKITFELKDDEVDVVNNWLENRKGQTHFTFRGQSLKAYKMEVLDDVAPLNPIYLDYSWSDDHLIDWEKEVFGENWEQGELIRKTFKEYLIDKGAWVVNGEYPNGAVKDRPMYIELTAKWSKLQDLRFRNEKAKGFPTYEAIAKKIRKGIAEFSNRIDVRDDKLKEEINDEREIERGIQLDDIPF